tara:strand:- start:8292 stop:9641 length:1350 start_codon:yes stop_codon:yes gene_type:complete
MEKKMIKNNKELSYIKLKNFLHNKDSFKRGPFGSALKKAFFVESGYKVYEQKNAINKNNTIGEYYITEEKFKELESFSIKKGDIIISCSGTVGESYIIPENSKEGVINQALLRIRTPDNVNNLFFNYLLKSNYMRKKFLEGSQGGVIKNLVSMKIFKDIEIPNFEKEEQDKIVKILDKQQSLIDSYKEKLSLLEKQESYYQDELLSGRIRVKLNSENEKVAIDKGFIVNGELVEGKEKEFEEWLSINFKDKIELYENEFYIEKNINGKNIKVSNEFLVETLEELSKNIKTGKLNANASKDNGKYPFFTCSQETRKIDKYSFDQEAILIAGNGEVGESKYYKGKFDAYQRTYVLGDFQIHSMFLFKYIKKFFKKYLENRSVGGVIKFIKINDIKEFNIIKPNNKVELISIFTMIYKIESLNKNIKEKIKIEEEKMDYLMDELLSGRIRVE